MIEEALNFGMNTVHILQMSDLDEKVDEKVDDLNKVLRDISLLQKSMEQKQLGSIEIQEKIFQQQQYIQELRNSVFNLKISMEEVCQSDIMNSVVKFLQFRDTCASPAMKAFDVNHYITFEDKEYVSNVEKYLFYTRDELFNSFSSSVQKIFKDIEDKESQLQCISAEELIKPTAPLVPLSVDELEQLNEKKPIKPPNYYKLSANDYEVGATNGKSVLFINSLFIKQVASVALFIILAMVLLYLPSGETFGLIIILIVITWVLLVPYSYYVENIKLPNIKQFFEYEVKLKNYQEQQNKINENNKILKYEESDIAHYEEELKNYQKHKEEIRNLKNEISKLYEMLTVS